jgi:hypothetical protein
MERLGEETNGFLSQEKKSKDFFDKKGGFSRGDQGEEKRNTSFPVPP